MKVSKVFGGVFLILTCFLLLSIYRHHHFIESPMDTKTRNLNVTEKKQKTQRREKAVIGQLKLLLVGRFCA